MFLTVRHIPIVEPVAVEMGLRAVHARSFPAINRLVSFHATARKAMQAKATTRLPVFVEFGSQNTRLNLPRASALKRKESNFLRKFERVYLTAELKAAVAGREFGLEGFGRADLVWLAWQSRSSGDEFTALELKKRIRLTAIEGKVSDWRKGLQQAFRYRYFAHRSLLVLPLHQAEIAAQFLPTFRQLSVGLWGFDEKTGRLKKWFTPRSTTPLNRNAWVKALHLFESSLDLGKVAKRG